MPSGAFFWPARTFTPEASRGGAIARHRAGQSWQCGRRLWLSAALYLPAIAQPAAVSTTPYAVLYQVLAPVREIVAYDRLIALQRVRSRDAAVAPRAIRITIRAKAGPIALPVAVDGSVEFPVTDALRSENPGVETNQPKGSLALTVNAALRVSDRKAMAWRDIETALAQAETLFAKTAAGGAHKIIAGIEIDFDTATPASVTLTGKGARLFAADADGQVIIARDLVVDPAQAQLEFSRPPRHILPYVAP